MSEPISQEKIERQRLIEAYYNKPMWEITIEEIDAYQDLENKVFKIEDYFQDDESVSLWPQDPIRPFTPKSLKDFVSLEPNGWLIKNVIPRAELCMIYGPPSCGKTFAALDMGMSIARSLPTWGGERIKGGKVVYICAEAPRGFKNRVLAYLQRHDLTCEELNNFQVIDNVPNFLSINDHKSISDRISKADVIFIDTLSSVIAGGDENLGKDMNILVSNCKALSKATGATIVLIGHSGKNIDSGHRGWSGMLGAVDAEIKVEALGTTRTLTVTKQKEGESGKQYGFFLQPIELGEDEDGDPITSCSFEHSEVKITEKPKKQIVLGNAQKIVIDCFNSIQEKPVLVGDLISAAASLFPQDPTVPDERRKRARSAIERLHSNGLIIINGDLIYPK